MDKKLLEKKVAEAIATIGKSPRSSYAALVTEMVMPRHVGLDIFNSFMPTETRNPGDYMRKRVRKGRFRAR